MDVLSLSSIPATTHSSSPMQTTYVNLGSLRLCVNFDRSFYPDSLSGIFGTPLKASLNGSQQHVSNANLSFVEISSDKARFVQRPDRIPRDGMVILKSENNIEIHTEALAAYIVPDDPADIQIIVITPDIRPFDLKVHLTVALHKALFLLGRLTLHAAAAHFVGKTNVFIGSKGAGKSTVSLKLGQSGAAILGEDHVILTRQGTHFLISGCDEVSRVTEKTENYFFHEKLSVAPQNVDGVMKKEFSTRTIAKHSPYKDFPIHRMFFIHVGKQFKVQHLSKKEAMLAMIRETKHSQRFAAPTDYRYYITYLRNLIDCVPAFDLTLSQDIGELSQLLTFLQDLKDKGR